jgi:hypothetical protein
MPVQVRAVPEAEQSVTTEDGPIVHDLAITDIADVTVRRGFVLIRWKIPQFNPRQKKRYVRMILPVTAMPEVLACLLNAMNEATVDAKH